MHASTEGYFLRFYSDDLSSVMNIWSGLRSGQQRYGFISLRIFPGYQCSRKLIISLYQDTDTGFMLISFWWCFFMHRIPHKCCWDSFVSEWIQRIWDQPEHMQYWLYSHRASLLLWNVWGHVFKIVLRNANHRFLREQQENYSRYPLAKQYILL